MSPPSNDRYYRVLYDICTKQIHKGRGWRRKRGQKEDEKERREGAHTADERQRMDWAVRQLSDAVWRDKQTIRGSEVSLCSDTSATEHGPIFSFCGL